ncbi:MAG: hypothetical protein JST40_13220 [Armatimonadetes bacterium]|nr:hypothetical protein [Armatimonadota bacterium]
MAKDLVIRVDLDYVPWNQASSGSAEQHAGPAVLLRLLEFARNRGLRMHFFVSTACLAQFPMAGEVILNEGHDLDLLGGSGDSAAFARIGHEVRFVAQGEKDPLTVVSVPENLSLAASVGDRFSMRAWWDRAVEQLRRSASSDEVKCVALSVDQLAVYDAELKHLAGALDRLLAMGYTVTTFRQARA